MNAIDRTLNCKKILKICQLRNLIKCKLNIFSGDSRKSWLKEGGGGANIVSETGFLLLN